MSAFGGKADIKVYEPMSANDKADRTRQLQRSFPQTVNFSGSGSKMGVMSNRIALASYGQGHRSTNQYINGAEIVGSYITKSVWTSLTICRKGPVDAARCNLNHRIRNVVGLAIERADVTVAGKEYDTVCAGSANNIE